MTTDTTLQVGGLVNGATAIAPLTALASPGQLTQGQPATLVFTGQPGSAVLLLFDAVHGNVPVPGLRLPWLLGTRILMVGIHTIGASGAAQMLFTLPVDPVWRDRFLFFQGASVSPSLAVELTNLADFRMR